MSSEYSKQRERLLKEKKAILKLKRDLEEEKKELYELKKQKLALIKLKKEVRQLKQSPEIEQYKKLAKKGVKIAGKGLGKFFVGAYNVAERVTRPEPSRTVKRKQVKKYKRK